MSSCLKRHTGQRHKTESIMPSTPTPAVTHTYKLTWHMTIVCPNHHSEEREILKGALTKYFAFPNFPIDISKTKKQGNHDPASLLLNIYI